MSEGPCAKCTRERCIRVAAAVMITIPESWNICVAERHEKPRASPIPKRYVTDLNWPNIRSRVEFD
jgi:hypothetical protein